MKIKNIILVLAIILGFCVISPSVFVQATPGDPSDSLTPKEPAPENDLEKDPEPDPPSEPDKPEEPVEPKPDESEEEEPDSTSDKETEKDGEEGQSTKPTTPTKPKDNSNGNNVSRDKAKPSTSNNNSNHKSNSSPSESSWESPSSNSSSNTTWQESQDNEEDVIEETEMLEEEDTRPVAWTLEEMLSNNAWVSVVDGIYYAIIGEEQQEITEEVAVTLGYELEVEADEPEPPGDDFMESYHLAMYNKGIEKLPLNDLEYDWERLAQPDYEEASDQVVASNVELDAFSEQKIFAFSVLGIAAVTLIVVYVAKRRRA